MDVVFHQAAYGGYMPEISKYVTSTASEPPRCSRSSATRNLPVKKIVVASSQAV